MELQIVVWLDEKTDSVRICYNPPHSNDLVPNHQKRKVRAGRYSVLIADKGQRVPMMKLQRLALFALAEFCFRHPDEEVRLEGLDKLI